MASLTCRPQRPACAAPAPKKNLVVGIGAMLASNDAGATLVTYSLGSCVGVSIYDPVAKVGGMLHALLPDSSVSADRAASRPYTFVDLGLPAMFLAVYALGAVKLRLIVKMAGGAGFLDHKKIFNIGMRNIEAVMAMLAGNGVKLEAHATGGRESRTMRLDLNTGEITLDIPGRQLVSL